MSAVLPKGPLQEKFLHISALPHPKIKAGVGFFCGQIRIWNLNDLPLAWVVIPVVVNTKLSEFIEDLKSLNPMTGIKPGFPRVLHVSLGKVNAEQVRRFYHSEKNPNMPPPVLSFFAKETDAHYIISHIDEQKLFEPIYFSREAFISRDPSRKRPFTMAELREDIRENADRSCNLNQVIDLPVDPNNDPEDPTSDYNNDQENGINKRFALWNTKLFVEKNFPLHFFPIDQAPFEAKGDYWSPFKTSLKSQLIAEKILLPFKDIFEIMFADYIAERDEEGNLISLKQECENARFNLSPLQPGENDGAQIGDNPILTVGEAINSYGGEEGYFKALRDRQLKLLKAERKAVIFERLEELKKEILKHEATLKYDFPNENHSSILSQEVLAAVKAAADARAAKAAAAKVAADAKAAADAKVAKEAAKPVAASDLVDNTPNPMKRRKISDEEKA